MNFELTEEQTLLDDTLRGALARATPAEHWDALSEQGFAALAIPERAGGAGLGAVETLLVAVNLGRLCSPAPWVSRVVLPGAWLAPLETGSADDLLRSIASGERAVVIAGLEPEAAPLAVEGDRLSGEWLVPDGVDADSYILVNGDRAWRLDAGTPGLTVVATERLDGGSLARLEMDNAAATPFASGEGVLRASAAAFAAGNAALCGEAAGLMQTLVETTVDYLKTRRQFGSALSNFQALQHRMVDMRLQYELSWSMAAGAAMAIDAGRGDRVVSAAKVQTCLSGRKVAEEAIQFHGAIGMTDELPVGAYARRLLVIEQLLGNRFDHLARFKAA